MPNPLSALFGSTVEPPAPNHHAPCSRILSQLSCRSKVLLTLEISFPICLIYEDCFIWKEERENLLQSASFWFCWRSLVLCIFGTADPHCHQLQRCPQRSVLSFASTNISTCIHCETTRKRWKNEHARIQKWFAIILGHSLSTKSTGDHCLFLVWGGMRPYKKREIIITILCCNNGRQDSGEKGY